MEMQEGRQIRKYILVLALLAIFFMPGDSKLIFDFKCQGTDGTLTSYSYLRESPLEENGYVRGLKTGSFNYLENGKNINFEENIAYKYGNNTNKTNSTVTHNLKIHFEGGKIGRSISKFYGTGFFKNNRAISAFKEIRYEDLRKYDNVSPYKGSPIKATLGKTYNATNIDVTANLMMDMTPGIGYDLKYKAIVDDGVVETRDRAGWTNRTGARRIDLEHTALMRGGKLTIYNNLSDSAPFPTGPEPEVDWLPCCMSGSLPSIEGLNSPWPSSGVFNTLKPEKILPSCSNYSNCVNLCAKCKEIKDPEKCSNCSRECIKNCNWTCKENSCEGYECINTYENSQSSYSNARTIESIASLFASAYYESSGPAMGKYETSSTEESIIKVSYKIEINNDGDIKLHDVILNVTLPKSTISRPMLYKVGSAKYDGETLSPPKVNEGDPTTLQWELGSFDTGKRKYVVFETIYPENDKGLKPELIRVEVSSPVAGSKPITYISEKGMPKPDRS
jgi:head-tail adaptor